jgi:tetratricopeptide (TPR) repeat protein
MTLIDRQNLDKIIAEQDFAAQGRFSDADYVRIGNLTNAQYLLAGSIQKLSGDTYALQLSVSEASTGVQKAAFTGNGTLSQLEGSGSLINRASEELLAQLGVRLTEAGRLSLSGGNTFMARAENAYAKGVAAQTSGDQLEALFSYAQAASFDPGQLEALARLGTLSSTISGGSISERIMNDLQARDQWVAVFRETARFYNEHPPYELIFDPSLEQEGETDYAKRTAVLAMRVGLVPSEAGFAALNALLEGLEQTGRRGTWGFAGWPMEELNPKVSGTRLFSGRNTTSFAVEVLLLNDKQKQVGKGSITLSAAPGFATGNKSVTLPVERFDTIRFQNVKADELSPVLTIVINSVNGIPSKTLNSAGYMRIAPGDIAAAVYKSRGDAHIKERDYDRAIADYTEAIRLDPNNADHYISRGWAYVRKGDYDRAFEDYSQAIKLDPNNADRYISRGFAYYYKGDNNRAIADYTQAIKLVPNNADHYISRGGAYGSKDDYDRAFADYTEAIRLDPNNADRYFSRGLAYYGKGDNDRAIADYTEAIKLGPNNADYYIVRAWAYDNKGDNDRATADYDRAIVEYTEAIKLEPNNAGHYISRGAAYDNKGDYDRAIADYNQAIRLEPKNAKHYDRRAWAYYMKGDYDRAIVEYTEAIKLDQNDAWFYNSRGNAYYKKKDYNRAFADYTEAVRLDPNNQMFKDNLELARKARER